MNRSPNTPTCSENQPHHNKTKERTMDSITLENFRCFRERQTARLAPLTLLVGENSTGKTSFLALIRALWDVAYGEQIPDFKEDPYDLGSFEEIANRRNANSPSVEHFTAGFSRERTKTGKRFNPYSFEVAFEKKGTIPIPIKRVISHENISIEEEIIKPSDIIIRLKTERGEWQYIDKRRSTAFRRLEMEGRLMPLYIYARQLLFDKRDNGRRYIRPLSDSPKLTIEDLNSIRKMAQRISRFLYNRPMTPYYASAPVRSKPKRTYDPSRPIRDPEGDYVPMYLADLYSQNREEWKIFKEKLEAFGENSGLFDEISIEQLGKAYGGPFQIQIRKFSNNRKGPRRNLIDVGYGVSQVLPLVTELLRTDSPDMFLLQQPEVHLHPSAQAALGSLFCQVAASNKQLIIETHSDYIMDRVRMDIRDESSPLKPHDVSLLFFERGDLDVRIHSLRFDEEGNVLGTPPGYRQFFMEETRRFIGL